MRYLVRLFFVYTNDKKIRKLLKKNPRLVNALDRLTLEFIYVFFLFPLILCQNKNKNLLLKNKILLLHRLQEKTNKWDIESCLLSVIY